MRLREVCKRENITVWQELFGAYFGCGIHSFPIVTTSKEAHLLDVINNCDVTLTPSDARYIFVSASLIRRYIIHCCLNIHSFLSFCSFLLHSADIFVRYTETVLRRTRWSRTGVLSTKLSTFILLKTPL